MARPKKFDPDVAVDRAVEVFWRKGYAATTPQDLIDALGIGKGSLYNAFGSKHELFERALCRYRDGQLVALVDLLEAPGPVKERVRSTLGFLAEIDIDTAERPLQRDLGRSGSGRVEQHAAQRRGRAAAHGTPL